MANDRLEFWEWEKAIRISSLVWAHSNLEVKLLITLVIRSGSTIGNFLFVNCMLSYRIKFVM